MPGSARSAVPKMFRLAPVAVLAAAAALVSVGPPALAASSATINGGDDLPDDRRIRRLRRVRPGFGDHERAVGRPAAGAEVPVQPVGGAGLTILRNEISADSGYTIEPTAPSSPTATPTYASLASISNDQGQLSLAQAIKSAYGVTNVFADAWSAPPFMKVNNSVDNGGALCGVPGATCSSGDWRQAYANYLKQYAADYAAAGVPLTYIGPENEANFAPCNYDGMTLTPSQTANFLDVLGPDDGVLRPVRQDRVLRDRGLGLRAAVLRRDRGGPDGAGRHGGLHRPRLHRGAHLAAVRLVQARLGDRVVHVRELGPGVGRRQRRVRPDLGAAHLHRAGQREPVGVPVLVGLVDAVGERRQREPHPDQRLDRDARPAGCGRSRTSATSSAPAPSASAPPPPTATSPSTPSRTPTGRSPSWR